MADLATYDPSIEAQAQDSAGNPMPGATLSFWTARTGGTQIVQVYESDGVTLVPGGTLTADAFGFLPRQIKIDRTAYPQVWVDGGGGDRVLLAASDMDSRIVALQASVDSMQTQITAILGANGVAQLDSTGKVLASQLPSFATEADIASVQSDLDTAKNQMVSLEDVPFSQSGHLDLWPQGSAAVSRTQTNPIAPDLWVVTAACQVVSLQLVFKSMTLAASDTAWWALTPQRFRSGTPADMITGGKTTKNTGGEGITAEQPWTYDAFTWITAACQLQKGDIFRINFVPNNTPAGLIAPVTWTLGLAPL